MDLSRIPYPRTSLDEATFQSTKRDSTRPARRHSTNLKTLDNEDSLDHQEFRIYSVSKRSVIK